MNYYIHTAKLFSPFIGGKSLKIFGSFYCQQNNLTCVCAHSTLRMILNNLQFKSLNIDNETINESLLIDHCSKKFSQGGYSGDKGFSKDENVEFLVGLNTVQLEDVLKTYELKSIQQNFFDEPNINYADLIYSTVESGYPAALAFTTSTLDLHVVPIIGHTLNTDIWYPEAAFYYSGFKDTPYHPSNGWVDHFVFHDDNLGMYYSLPAKSLYKITLPKEDPYFRAYCAIGIFPQNVQISPTKVQRYSAVLLYETLREHGNFDNKWNKELGNHLSKNRYPVIRTFLVDRSSYRAHLENMHDFGVEGYSSEHLEYIDQKLKGIEYFWMNEISLPDLYSGNKTKLGEILLKCETTQSNYNVKDLFLLMRLPNMIFTPGGIKGPTNIKQHQNMFRLERPYQRISYEW